ncbi:MAG: AI-2E family transporter [Spirochaetia bacterium]|nr:AI-2E family transporter [Spirochaetia bacterium]
MTTQQTELSTRIVRWTFFILVIAVTAFIFYGVTNMIVPIVVALLLTAVLNPAIDLLEAYNLPRGVAVLIVLAVVVAFGYVLFGVIAPMIVGELQSLASQGDVIIKRSFEIIHSLQTFLRARLPAYVPLDKLDPQYITDLLSENGKKMALDAVQTVPGMLIYFLITPIITLILLLQGDDIYRNLLAAVPNRYFQMVMLILHKINSRITSYLKGLTIEWFIFVCIMSTGFSIIGLPYAVLIGLVSGTMNIVPYVGPVAGLVPAVAASLLDPTGSLLIPMLAVYGLALLVDTVFTQPVILAKSVQLHPLVAILALLTFQKLLGIMGMVIAIPVAGVVVVTIEVMYRSLKAFRVI